MSEIIKQQKEVGGNINKEQAKMREKQEINRAIDNNFSHFNPEEKNKLIQVITKLFNWKAASTKKQIYLEIIKLHQTKCRTPKNLIEKLNQLLSSNENDLRNKKNKEKILIPSQWNVKEKQSSPKTAWKYENHILRWQEKLNLIKETIKKTQESYKNLAPQLKTFTPEQLQSKTAQLWPETQKKLQKQGIKPHEYASFLLSRELIDQKQEQSPQTLDFLESLKSLESTLGIRAPDNLPMPWIDKDYIRDNPSLIQHIKISPDFNTLSWPINFWWLKTAQDNFKFVKLFGDPDLIKLQDQISYFFLIQTFPKLISKKTHQTLDKK